MLSIVLPLILATTSLVSQAKASPTPPSVDTRAATSVEITGDASTVTISTNADLPYAARLSGRRSGWFVRWYSSWAASDCEDGGTIRLDAAVLRIEIAQASWFDLGDCITEVHANIPAESAVSIDQKALQARLKGQFSSVTIDSAEADVELDGHATKIMLSGNAMRAHLTFDQTRHDETIDIKAKALDAYLAFAQETKISYAIKARASFVDSALLNSVGAKPRIAIDGDFVRATIR